MIYKTLSVISLELNEVKFHCAIYLIATTELSLFTLNSTFLCCIALHFVLTLDPTLLRCIAPSDIHKS